MPCRTKVHARIQTHEAASTQKPTPSANGPAKKKLSCLSFRGYQKLKGILAESIPGYSPGYSPSADCDSPLASPAASAASATISPGTSDTIIEETPLQILEEEEEDEAKDNTDKSSGALDAGEGGGVPSM